MFHVEQRWLGGTAVSPRQLPSARVKDMGPKLVTTDWSVVFENESIGAITATNRG